MSFRKLLSLLVLICIGGTSAHAQTTCTEITVVGWINGNAIQLPPGESSLLQLTFPELGPPFSLLGIPGAFATWDANCHIQLASLSGGSLFNVSNNATDKAYASAWLLKYSGNHNPGAIITPATFVSSTRSYRIFNDYAPGAGIAQATSGNTPDPCDGFASFAGVVDFGRNGAQGTSINGYQFQLAEVRVSQKGADGWSTLNNGQVIPWIWSVVEFDQNGNPVNIGTVSSPLIYPGNYQIFPTYSIYKNGQFAYMINQSSVPAFASPLTPNELQPGDVQ